MSRMGTHSAGKGGPLRRAWLSAWTVAISMAATTMGFQVYHALKWGHEPWGVAYPVGIVPLLISLCILEIVAEWRDAPGWVKAGAYAIMGGSMFLSASSTGKVVLASSPPHMSLLFGLLLDGAALLAVHFILNGPRKADERAAAEAARQAAADRAEADERAALRRKLADVTARAEAEVTALHAAASEAEAERGKAAAGAEAEAARAAELAAVAEAEAAGRAAALQELEDVTARRDQVIAALCEDLDAERAAAGAARQQAARAEERARKLAVAADRKRPGSETRKPAAAGRERPGSGSGPGPEAGDDLDSEALVLKYLAEGKSASEAGRLAGLSDSRGRQIARSLAKTAPQEAAADSDGSSA